MSDCLSDHSVIFFIWKIKIPRSPPKYITLRQCKNINFDCFIHDLTTINWDRLELIPFVEDAWNFFYTEFNNVIDVGNTQLMGVSLMFTLNCLAGGTINVT